MTQAHVAFPAGYFARHCQHEYSNPMEALCREFLQNSLDAGARAVEFFTTNESIMVRDDGRGITRERMVEALLTMGGTDKQEGSIGGFGNAKVALLFAHNAYRIRTLDTIVDGQVLGYRMRSIEEGEATLAGAEFTIWPANEWSFEPLGFARVLTAYLATCNLVATVTLNGQVVPTGCTGRKIDLEFAHGRVLSRRLPNGEQTYSAFVRVNGLTMFRESVRSTDRQVIIELVGDFREMFTSNRDGLRHPYRSALSDLTQQMAVDPKSFDRKKEQTVTYPGSLQRFFQQVAEATRVLTLHMTDHEAQDVVATVARLMQKAPEKPVEVAMVLRARGKGDCLSSDEAAKVDSVFNGASAPLCFGTDFIVSIENTEYRQPPARFTPGKMLLRHQRLARLWRHCINLVLRANNISFSYQLGFVLDPDKRAYFKGTQDAGMLLINPERMEPGCTARERFFTVLQLAAHELAHRRFSWHDERFVHEEEALLRNALVKMKPLSLEIRAAGALDL